MKLIQLEYLLSVAREGSFSAAAAALSVAQPAISQQIKSLEEELGTRLFLRTPKGTTPTDAGIILRDHAIRVLERVELARNDVISSVNEVAGEVTLHINNAMAGKLLPPLVKALNERYPGVMLHVTPLPSHQVRLNLEKGRVDLGVLPDYEKLTKVNAKHLKQEPLYFLCDPDHEAACDAGRPIRLQDAMRYPMVTTHSDQPFRQCIEDAVKAQDLSHIVRFETNELIMIFSHVASGHACSILPQCAIEERERLGSIITRRIVDPEITQSYLILWPKSVPLSTASLAVRDTVLLLLQNEDP
ncbi:MAG: LysR family transcriptional regulator [Pseudomonadota bacterium]